MKRSTTSNIFKDHVREAKNRGGYILLSLISTFFISYHKSTQLMYVFLLSFSFDRYQEKSFIFTDVHEAFSSTISICITSSLFCTLPLALYQFICFVLPSWYTHEKKRLCNQILALFLFWMGYIFMIHSFLIPQLCSFLLQFQVQTDCLSISVEPKIFSYVSWATNLFGTAAILFLLISCIYFCFLYQVFYINEWSKYRKISILIILILASALSPPELWSQFTLTLISFLFFEFLVWSCFIYNSLQKMKLLLT